MQQFPFQIATLSNVGISMLSENIAASYVLLLKLLVDESFIK
jgi:hypothetical protein